MIAKTGTAIYFNYYEYSLNVIMTYFSNTTGGWSLLNSNDSGWSINGRDFVKERYLGSTAFFAFDLNIESQNSSRFILVVSLLMHNDSGGRNCLFSLSILPLHWLY